MIEVSKLAPASQEVLSTRDPVPTVSGPRPRVAGKFLFVGARKLLVRGVTYGTFRPDADGITYPDRLRVHADFCGHGVGGIQRGSPLFRSSGMAAR